MQLRDQFRLTGGGFEVAAGCVASRPLEAGERGVYSGAIGYFGFNGSADFGMTIRTVVFQGSKASIGVGGGITSDSDPLAELEETKLKAQALLRVLNAPDPWA